MKTALLIARHDLRLRLRDRSAIVIAFIAPLVLAFIVSLAFRTEQGFNATYAVVNMDDGPIGASFEMVLASLPKDTFTVDQLESAKLATKTIEDDEASAAFIIPAGLSDSITSGGGGRIDILRNVNSPVGGEVAQAIADGFASEVNANSLAIQTAISSGADSTGPALQNLIDAATSQSIPATVIDAQVGVRQVRSVDYFGPGMAIFFVFFTVQMAPQSLLAERQQNTLQRMAGAPVRPASILAGKFIAAFVLGLLSLLVMAVATSSLLGAHWGDPLAVVALSSAIVFAAIGIASLTSFGARSVESAGGVGSIVAVVLGMVGGSFFPVNLTPGFIRTAALATPHGWGMRGFTDLIASGGGLEVIGLNLAVLLAIGSVTLTLGLLLARRLVVR